jgi:hypothetical protein
MVVASSIHSYGTGIVAECHHTNKGVQCKAWDDVGKACHSWELK